MCVLLYNPTFFDDLEWLKWGHWDHFGALPGLARRTDLGFWGPDLTKLLIQLIAQPFSFVRTKKKGLNIGYGLYSLCSLQAI